MLQVSGTYTHVVRKIIESGLVHGYPDLEVHTRIMQTIYRVPL